MNQSLSYIEIIFTPHAKGFKATTPMFPKCKGLGSTREEATQRLGKSIADSFSINIFDGLKDIFASQDFTDVLDPTGPKGQERRIFPLFSSSKGRRIHLELPPLAELSKTKDKKQNEKDISSLNDIVSLSAVSGFIQELVNEEWPSDKPNLPVPKKPESIIFGFPLNFN